MWLWEAELRERGFRRKSDRYWQCERRFGLPGSAHLSVFSWSEQTIPPGRGGGRRFLVELTEFHVTFRIALEHIHFYYHERGDNEWQPCGHTSATELRRLGCEPAALGGRRRPDAAGFCRRSSPSLSAAPFGCRLGGSGYRHGGNKGRRRE